MENSEIQSSQFASTMGNPDFQKRMYVEYREHEVELIAKSRRNGRKTEAEDFRAEYFYGRCDDKKTCIWPGDRHSWWDSSSGITWVGVHGNDSICMVTKAGDLDVTRVHGFLLFSTKERVLRKFRRTVISEIEDLADPSSKPCEMRDKSIKTPFGVVSVVPVTDKVHNASSDGYQESKIIKFKLEDLDRKNRGEISSDDECEIDEDDEDSCLKYFLKLDRRHKRTMLGTAGDDEEVTAGDDEEKTIKFLQDEMKRVAAITIKETVQECDERKAIEFLEEKMMKPVEDFTLEETIQTAISAFQHLFNKNFKANEIEVCVMDPDYFVYAEDAHYKDIYVNHLETIEIEQHLSVIDQACSNGSSSPPKKRSKGSSSGTF